MSTSRAASKGLAGALAGRHAVVTGGGSGIGAAIARVFASHGATLTLVGRNSEHLQKGVKSLEGSEHGFVKCDVGDHDAVAAAMHLAEEARGAIGILVNAAGSARTAPVAKTAPDLWDDMISVNLGGTYHCIHAVLPPMLRAGWGRIVNVSSTAGLVGYAYAGAYCAAKHGVIGLTRALALEVARTGITVNAVCPGYTETPLLDEAIAGIVAKTGRTVDEARKALIAQNPQGRLVTAPEVANAVAWLCLPGSEAIHGQAIAIAGGEVMCG